VRKYLLAVPAVCLLLLSVLGTLTSPRPCPVTKAAYDRIQTGRSLAQVEEVLGGPPGDYRTRPTYPVYLIIDGGGYNDACWWHGNEGLVAVCFDHAGLVTAKGFNDYTEGDLIDMLQWRLGSWWDDLRERDHPPR
jgi:hypothetical protein